ncbi:MAG TPA: hypothetical protein VHB21_25625, partial [Minicystis sp.]|nr:hypothetical protein [Minicystis sp.]
MLAAHASARAEIVPRPPDDGAASRTGQLPLFPSSHGASSDEPPSEPAKRKPWAWLLRHVFAVDVTVGP